MKARLKFDLDLPEDRYAFNVATAATDLKLHVDFIHEHLRKLIDKDGGLDWTTDILESLQKDIVNDFNELNLGRL